MRDAKSVVDVAAMLADEDRPATWRPSGLVGFWRGYILKLTPPSRIDEQWRWETRAPGMGYVCGFGSAARHDEAKAMAEIAARSTRGLALGQRIVCDACIECLYTGGAWNSHTCGLPNVEITQEGT